MTVRQLCGMPVCSGRQNFGSITEPRYQEKQVTLAIAIDPNYARVPKIFDARNVPFPVTLVPPPV